MVASKRLCAVALIAGLGLVLSAPSAHARKYCQGDNHLHYGNGTGAKKKIARRNALASWAGFTAFEYGNAYAYWRHARFKKTRCSRSGGGWSCQVSANPCRVTR